MGRISDIIASFRRFEADEGVCDSPFVMLCSLSDGATSDEIRAAWAGRAVPDDLLELWQTCREARLFEDAEYGQWGLRLLSPGESAERSEVERLARPAEIGLDDIVFAEFLGDQELLLRGTHSEGVLVALPLDPRADWYTAAPDVGGFLAQYFESCGEKYWES